MKSLLYIIPLTLSLAACGQVDRGIAQLTGSAVSCLYGVEYIQFASGVTVKYKQDGTVATCPK